MQLGDLSLGEQAEVVVELASSAPKDGSNVEVLDAVLRYDEGMGGGQREERVFVGAKATEDKASIDQGHAKTVEDAFARAKDAAATLERIEIQRNTLNANQKRPMPPSLSAPSPLPPPATPLPRPHRSGLEDSAAPRAASPAAAAKPTDLVEPSPEQLRKAHDQAINTFQAH